MIQMTREFMDNNKLGNSFLKNGDNGGPTRLFKSIRTRTPFFIDTISGSNNFKSDIDSCVIGRLISSTNEYLIQNMICSWGYTGYNHTCGHLYLGILIQHQFLSTVVNTYAKYRFIESTRNDYIRDISYYEVWIHNPNWNIRPLIAFMKDQRPVILTY